MTIEEFRTRYPEFASAGEAMVRSALADAAKMLDASIWGTKYDVAHGLQAAHILAESPFGASAQLIPEGQPSPYLMRIQKLQRTVAPRGFTLNSPKP